MEQSTRFCHQICDERWISVAFDRVVGARIGLSLRDTPRASAYRCAIRPLAARYLPAANTRTAATTHNHCATQKKQR